MMRPLRTAMPMAMPKIWTSTMRTMAEAVVGAEAVDGEREAAGRDRMRAPVTTTETIGSAAAAAARF
jgi:hypothetical protein